MNNARRRRSCSMISVDLFSAVISCLGAIGARSVLGNLPVLCHPGARMPAALVQTMNRVDDRS